MRIIGFIFFCLSFLASIASAQADRRVAFVVGNGAYQHVTPLPNPPIDSRSMASLLRNVGFEVVEGVDLGRDGMTEKLREFALKAQGADIALFFYAGHGISVNGKNYLIPIDADLKSEVDIKFGAAIDVDVALDQTMADAKIKLILLDACRDNPFAARVRSAARTRSVVVGNGLAEMTTGEGTLIAFATGPGHTALDGTSGGNSPFTKALLNNIASPGIEIQQAMTKVRAEVNDETRKQQLPWGHTNLIGAVYLNPSANTAGNQSSPNAPPTTTASVDPSVEVEFWRSIKETNSIEELNAYLVKYPNGQFKPLALARIAALQEQQKKAPPAKSNSTIASATRSTPEMAPAVDIFTAEASIATENDLLLDPRARRDIQTRLTVIGFSTPASGQFTDATRQALIRWQTARGYPKTGYLNKLQNEALLRESAAASTRPNNVVEQPRPQYQPQQQPQQRQQQPPSTASDAFIGGVIGGAIGGAIRRR